MKKQILSEEFIRMQKLAGFQLNENEQMSEAKEDLFNKYKSKIETLRDEFIADLKSNLKDLKKLSKEDKTKLSQMIHNLTGAVDDALSEGKKVEKKHTNNANAAMMIALQYMGKNTEMKEDVRNKEIASKKAERKKSK